MAGNLPTGQRSPTACNEGGSGVKALTLLLAVVLGMTTLASSPVAAEQQIGVSLEEADGPDDTCDLRINTGGPYEVTIDGGSVTVYENGAVVPIPQGSRLIYLRQERTFGSTAIGTNETCQTFVSTSSSTSSSGIGAPLLAGVIVGVVAVLGATWWFLIGTKRSANN